MYITKVAVIDKKITILDTVEQDYVNGSLNVDQIQFTFSGTAWSTLTKVATFITPNGTVYNAPILNNVCTIPHDAYSQNGTVAFGVYGISIDSGVAQVVLPSLLINLEVQAGAYQLGENQSSTPTPTQWEIYISQIEDMIEDLEEEIPTKTSELTNDSGFITKDANNLTNYTLSSALAAVATSGSYNDLLNKPTIPTKTSELTNDSNFVSDANYVHTDNNFTDALETKLNGIEAGAEVNTVDSVNGKAGTVTLVATDVGAQETLVSGTNIKTINNQSILGSGNIEVGGGGTGDYNNLSNQPQVNGVTLIGNKTTSDLGIVIPTKTSELTNDSNFVVDANYIHTDNNFTDALETKLNSVETGAQVNTVNSVNSKTGTVVLSASDVGAQETLQSGTNIKTISGNSVLGSGDLQLSISDLTDDTATTPIAQANTLTDLTATVTELNYMDGVTSNVQTQLDGKETADNTILKQADVVNNVASTSTTAPLSANQGKVLQTEIDNLKNIGRFLAVLDASNGTVSSQPNGSVGETYTYKVGDYYRVGAAGTYTPKNTLVFTIDGTSGSSNFETGSTSYAIGDVIYCSNVTDSATTWVLQASSGGGTVQDVQINGTSILSGGIANIPYASGSMGGVFRTGGGYSAAVDASGYIKCNSQSKATYVQMYYDAFVSRGTLENLKSTSITSSSTDVGYATPKAVYDFVKAQNNHIYGIRRKKANNSSSAWERTDDSIGLVANATKTGADVQNNFDSIYPWKDIISFNLDLTTHQKVAYYGDPDFKFDGTNGDVYTSIPEFWYKIFERDGYEYVQIANYAATGFTRSAPFDVARYITGLVDGKLRSYSGLAPAYSKTITQFRTLANGLGNDYCLLDWRYFILQLLYLVEYADYNSQNILGNGMSSMRFSADDKALIAETSTNRIVINTTGGNAFYVGQTVSIGTARENMSIAADRVITAIADYSADGVTGKAITFNGTAVNIAIDNVVWSSGQHSGGCDTLGMKSGCLSNDSKHAVIYRGIENIFGNIFQWVDGINIKDYQAYICYDPSEYVSDKITSPYVALGYVDASANGNAKTLGFDADNPLVRLPTEVGGSSSTYMCDYYYQNSGNRVALVGGSLNYGTYDGLWYWSLDYASSYATWHCGARVLKYQ